MIHLHRKNHDKNIRNSYYVNWMKKQKRAWQEKMIKFHQKSTFFEKRETLFLIFMPSNLELEKLITHTDLKDNCLKILTFKIWNFILVRKNILINSCESIILLCLDKEYETVILPINGTPTPFHISTIKVTITEKIHSSENEFGFLLIDRMSH